MDRMKSLNVAVFWVLMCSTATMALTISNVNPTGYTVQYDSLTVGATVYSDRDYTFDNVASLGGSTYIMTANNDKYSTDSSFMTFDIDQGCTVYVAHDGKTSPSWLLSSFTDTGEDIVVSSPQTYRLWSKDFAAGTVTLGGNEGGVSSSMYIVVIVPIPITTPPDPASNPSPADTTTDVSVEADLSWTAGTNAMSHDVYFGTTSPGDFQLNQTGTTFDPGILANGTTYYWRIDEINGIGTTTGTVWSFTTESAGSAPDPASDPSPTSTATDVSVNTDLSWTTGAGATSHDVYFGTTSPGDFQLNQAATTFDPDTLTLNTTYYWRIDEVNAYGTTTGTVWSFTTVEFTYDEVGYWTMDDNAASATVVDSAGGYNGTFSDATGNPNTSAHHSTDYKQGTGSLSFDGVDDYITLPRNAVLETGNATTKQLSATAWIKDESGGAAGWGTVMGTGDGGWVVARNGDQGNIMITGFWLDNGPLVIVGSDSSISDGQWHHVAVVYSGSSLTLYVDGVGNSTSTSNLTIDNLSNKGVLIGENAGATGRHWNGLIDDVRIYDEALTAEDVHYLYQPEYAWNPSPVDGATGATLDGVLSWSAGSKAVSHDVYFGTDENAVANAQRLAGDLDGDGDVNIDDLLLVASQWVVDTDLEDFAVLATDWKLSAAAEFKGNQSGTTFDPGTLMDNVTYYWRIDEVNASEPDSPWTGTVWSFSTNPAVGRQTKYESTTGRRYILYVPTDYDPQKMYPLVISSHGTGQNGDTEMDSTGPNSGYDNGTPTWPVLAEDNDVIVACPDMTGAYGWPDWTPDQLDQLASDDIATMAIIDEIEATYNINTSKILLTGFSGGGHIPHYVGLRHPDVFAALSPRHGNFNVDETPSPLPAGATDIPVYIFTGIDDPVSGTDEAIAWYTAQGFSSIDSDHFTDPPSNVHTTDRHHALDWFLGLTIGVSESGHYITYKGETLMLVGESGTQAAAQNSNLNHREWIDDCYDRGIRNIHVWSFMPARQKQDGTQIEPRWGYVYPDVVPWARNTSGPLALDQKYQWNLQAFDEGADGDYTHYWPRMRDMASYAKSKGILLGVTMFTGWTKHDYAWIFHPLNVDNGGHLTLNTDAVIIDTPGTEVWQETYDAGWSNAKKTQWVWEQLSIKMIEELGSMGNVYFVFFDEHSYSDGNMQDHFANFFRSRGMVWMDEEAVRSSVDWVMSGTFSGDDRNSNAVSGFMGTPVKPYFNLEGSPYMGDGVREAIWTFSVGGGNYVFHADEDQETVTTGIMGYDPYVPGGDKGMYKRDWLGHASRFFNEYVTDLDSLTPWNSLVGSGSYSLADPGREYAVYSKTGYSTITVNLSAAAGKTLDCRFYNPSDGTFNATFQRSGGSSSEVFTKPDSNDWVLHIVDPSAGGFTTDGLVALVEFKEGSGTTSSDLTGNGHTATLTGTSWGSGYVSVPSSPSDSRVSIATDSTMQGQSFTWDIWFEADPYALHERLAAQTDAVGGTGPEILIPSGDIIGVRINNDGAVFDVPTIGTRSTPAPPDHWGEAVETIHRNSGPEHIILTHDASTKTVRIFVALEGETLKLSFESTYTGTYSVGTVPLVLGNNPVAERIFPGKFFQFAYYDRALTYQADGSRNVISGEVYNNHLAGIQ